MPRPLAKVLADAAKEIGRLETRRQILRDQLGAAGSNKNAVKAINRELNSIERMLPSRREQLKRLQVLNKARLAQAAAERKKRK